MRCLSPALIVAALMSSAACGGNDGTPDSPPIMPDADLGGPVVVDVTASQPPLMLSSYRLFRWDPDVGFAFNDRVVPYDLNTALFSDYALKQRAIYVPPGTSATYDANESFELPVGSVLVKNFYFPLDFRSPDKFPKLIETRLMVRYPDGWHPLPYTWDAFQKDAVFNPSGEVRPISFIDAAGAMQTSTYLIPQRNQCEACHVKQTNTSQMTMTLVGVKARHLNRIYDYGGSTGKKNQLDHLTELGMLSGAPASAQITPAYDFRPIEANGVAALPPAEIETAARAYLDINCAHCHNPLAIQGDTTQLFLNHDNTDPGHLGVCKRPGSAGMGTGGFTFDIVPGNPEMSILYFRAHTTMVGSMMPLLGRSLRHERGGELLHAWIAGMPANPCATQ